MAEAELSTVIMHHGYAAVAVGCQAQAQKAPLPVKEARALAMPAALGDLTCCGSTSLMLSGETEPFIMLAAISSWLCSLTTIAFFSSSCKHFLTVSSRLTAEVPTMVHSPEIHDVIWILESGTYGGVQKEAG